VTALIDLRTPGAVAAASGASAPATGPGSLSFAGVTKRFGATVAVDGLDLDVGHGELLVVVGPSGCGKTTALRMVAGLERPSEGRILIGGVDVTDVRGRDRDLAMVFQSYALYPHLSVADNIAFGLRQRKLDKADIATRLHEASRMLELDAVLDRKPAQLSGGQRQRVALARAVVRQTDVLLMDEPLSNLDAQLRHRARVELAELHGRLGTTILYVTHDQVEAMTMGHRIAVMRDGVLQQCATPHAVYTAPANAFVASFIGSPAMNLLSATVERGVLRLASMEHRLDPAVAATLRADGEVTVGLRPEHVDPRPVQTGTGEPGTTIDGVVRVVEPLGSDLFATIEIDAAEPGVRQRLTVRFRPDVGVNVGERISVRTDLVGAHLFDPVSGTRLATIDQTRS
jgi:multiple sugar transport system ATP-binding protein